MSSVTVKLAPVAVQDRVEDETVDVTVRKLKLISALKRAGVSVDVTQVIADGGLEETIEGSPQLTLTILDRNYELLRSGVFGQTVDIELDGIPLRLVEVDLQDVEKLQLTFEHKLVALLRKQKGPLKASRASMNRAQFIELMLREVANQFSVTYICPEINKTQPVQVSKRSGRSLKSKRLSSKTLGSTVIHDVRGSGFGLTHLDIRDWDGSTVTLGPSQLRNAAIVLQVCKQLNAPPKTELAVVAACIVEPNKPFDNPPIQAGSGGSAGILQWGGGGTTLPSWANDVAQSVTHSLQDPGATGAGGMISLAQRNPGWSPGQIAQAEQGSAFPSRYDQAVPGAQTVIDAFTSAGGFAATGVTFGSGTTSTPAYEFSRGQPGQPEDSWTCIQRLAREVNWRAFVAGRRSFYFVTDDDLLAAQPAYRIGPTTRGIGKFTFQAEVGNRTVRIHHHRQPKPSEAQIDARFDRWLAPSGGVIEVEDYGVGDGRWIAIDTQRPLFDRAGTIQVRSPQKPLPEPPDNTNTSALALSGGGLVGGTATTFTASGTMIDKVYAAAQAIDRRNLSYVFGGGHGSWSDAATSSGLDCSSAVSLALYMAGLMPGFSGPIVSGDFANWGQPGPGARMTVWYTSGHVFIQFVGYPAQRFDTVEGGSGGAGPHLRFTAPGSPADTWEGHGFTARHWPGT